MKLTPSVNFRKTLHSGTRKHLQSVLASKMALFDENIGHFVAHLGFCFRANFFTVIDDCKCHPF